MNLAGDTTEVDMDDVGVRKRMSHVVVHSISVAHRLKGNLKKKNNLV